ncbi:MAG: M56 family metallopeptidase [Cellulosilyticaceae bacterium]
MVNNLPPILNCSLMGSIVIIIIIIIRLLLLKKIKKTWQYTLWMIVIIRLLLPILPTSDISLFNIFYKTNSRENITKKHEGAMTNNGIERMQAKNDLVSEDKEVFMRSRISDSPNRVTHSTKVLGYSIWLIGMVLVSTYFIEIYYRLNKSLNRCPEVKDEQVLKLVEDIKIKLNLKKGVKIVDGGQAMIFGIMRPTIMIPLNENKEALEIMLAHELTHYKYKDNVITYIQLVVVMLHWFNPFVWIAMYLMKQDMEFACDERVIKLGTNKKQYATTLLNNTVTSGKTLYLVHSMGENKNQTKRRILHMANFKKPKRWISFFIGVMVIIVAIICLTNPSTKEIKKDNSQASGKVERQKGIKNIAFLGVDESNSRTDTMVVASLNTKNNTIKIVSVPRATRVVWEDEQKKLAKQISGYDIGVSKISEMKVFGDKESIRALTIKSMETLLGQKIDSYVVIDLKGINKVVDTVGGLTINVPLDMDYDDPYQDLKIHLKKGLQTLNGNEVEQLVRYRKGENGGYSNGDIGRIETQQPVIQELITKTKNPESMQKIMQIIPELYSNIDTDMSFKDVKQYLDLVQKIELDNIAMCIVPGEGKYVENVSYFIPEVEATKNILKTK